MITDNLIAKLSTEPMQVNRMAKPLVIFARWLIASSIYVLIAIAISGVRKDLNIEIHSSQFLLELGLLIFVSSSSALGAIWLSFPDFRQNRFAFLLPFISLGAFVLFLIFDYLNSLPSTNENDHGIDCLICITLFSFIPSLYIFYALRAQRSTHILLTGMFAILSAAGLSCLILKLNEETNSVSHLIIWHYLPLCGFALLGAVIGKRFLRW